MNDRSPTNAVHLRFSSLFTDHIVFQQNAKTKIWGWATPNQTITVSANWSHNARTSVKADSSGKWLAALPTPAAPQKQTGYKVTVTNSSSQSISLNDVLLGEVWLLSGQSNMELPLAGWPDAEPPCPIEGGPEAIAAADHPQIRFIIAGQKPAASHQAEISSNSPLPAWTVCHPDTVPEFSAVGYFFARALKEKVRVPIGLIQSTWGGSACEAWTPSHALKTLEDFRNLAPFAPQSPDDNYTPSVLFNGMIAPLAPFTLAGILWYQGESNVGRHQQLETLFPAMIKSWRATFDQPELPFYFAHIAPWAGYERDTLPKFWQAQASALDLPNTALAVTIDCGDSANIHPPHKKPIGERFAQLALANRTDGYSSQSTGPNYQSRSIQDSQLTLHFSTSDIQLRPVHNGSTSFELAGADKVFHPANAKISGSHILLSTSKVPHPTQARYAWSNDPTPTLFGKSNQPAAPFQTH
ncbi:conserved domain protein [Verrucomicrobiia bacterium DG1235]|nr:conserved domain protein [Verrucomicrobiae bacterium DG1235]